MASMAPFRLEREKGFRADRLVEAMVQQVILNEPFIQSEETRTQT